MSLLVVTVIAVVLAAVAVICRRRRRTRVLAGLTHEERAAIVADSLTRARAKQRVAASHPQRREHRRRDE